MLKSTAVSPFYKHNILIVLMDFFQLTSNYHYNLQKKSLKTNQLVPKKRQKNKTNDNAT